MQSPPFPRYLVPARSKYSPQHHILKHPSFLSSLNASNQVSHPYKTTGKIIVLYILIFKFLDSNLGWTLPLHFTVTITFTFIFTVPLNRTSTTGLSQFNLYSNGDSNLGYNERLWIQYKWDFPSMANKPNTAQQSVRWATSEQQNQTVMNLTSVKFSFIKHFVQSAVTDTWQKMDLQLGGWASSWQLFIIRNQHIM